MQVRQAYTLAVMHNTFCKAFEQILSRLLRAIDSDQATTRSKALKSITQLLQKDPSILSRPHVLRFIKTKAQDQSPLVRDSVIDLLGKCITLRPDLEADLTDDIMHGVEVSGELPREFISVLILIRMLPWGFENDR
jgi:cohesin loading factor subunit SCC2